MNLPPGKAGMVGQAGRSYVRIKVCGITRPEDAEVAERAGADAIGLIFVPDSKRQITREGAAEVVAAVGPFITRVGVFVDADLAEVLELVKVLRLNAVQLHGNESAEYAERIGREARVVRAVAFSPAVTPESMATYPADGYLLDAPRPGSGVAFEWEAAAAWRGNPRLILAGGLNVGNVAVAVRTLRPYAVDVASGVEACPGVKDAAAVYAFVEAARGASNRQWLDR